MKKSIVVGLCVLLFAALTANAAEKEKTHLRATLRSFAEVPSNVTDGTGTFRAVVNDDTTITFTLTYHNLTAPAVVSHIHIGARNVAGGVTLFLCGPAGSPAHQVCPNDATNSGT